jgi:hypothetical protein
MLSKTEVTSLAYSGAQLESTADVLVILVSLLPCRYCRYCRHTHLFTTGVWLQQIVTDKEACSCAQAAHISLVESLLLCGLLGEALEAAQQLQDGPERVYLMAQAAVRSGDAHGAAR